MKKVLLIACAVICTIGVSFAQFKPQPFQWDPKYRGEVHIGGAFSNTLHIPGQEETMHIEFTGKSSLSRPLIETVHGFSLSNYLFVGAGLGLQFYAGEVGDMADGIVSEDKETWGMLAIPLFVNVKGFFPINDELKPFTTLSLGGTVMACSNANTEGSYEDYGSKYSYETRVNGGFYCDWGVGVEYKRWSATIGLQHQRYAYKESSTYISEYDSYSSNSSSKIKAYSHSFYLKVGMVF
jgi:hypothetical protein